MKRLRLRRKTLLRALRVAAFAFLLWVGAQRQAHAQAFSNPPFVSTGPGTYGADAGSYSSYSNPGVGLYDPGTGLLLQVGAGTSVTNTSASGYGGFGPPTTPYALVTLGGGSLLNSGTLALGSSAVPVAPGSGDYAAVVLGGAGNASVYNFGTIAAFASEGGVNPGNTIQAYGLYFEAVSAPSASLTFVNEAGATLSGAASANSNGAYGFGLFGQTTNGNIMVSNLGTISATGSGAYGSAFGVQIFSDSGNAQIDNRGSVTANGTASGAYADGLGATSNTGSAQVTNSGQVSAMYADRVYGISVNSSDTASLVLENSGTVLAVGSAHGVGLSSSSTSGPSTVSNTGFASGSGPFLGIGISSGSDSGTLLVRNDGTALGSSASAASGIEATSISGAMTALNTGAATGTVSGATASGYAYGLSVSSTSGAVTATNSGQLVATASGSSYTNAKGLYALSTSGSVDVVNTGTISSSATTTGPVNVFSTGIQVSSTTGATTLLNEGTVTAVGNGLGAVTGLSMQGQMMTLVNTGTVISSGAVGYGISASSYTTPSSISILNSGVVTVSGALSYGIYLSAPGTVTNTGSITAGTAAILTPNGSTVILAGTGAVNGLILGGTGGDHGAASTLNFNLTVRSDYTATKAALDAAIAADLYANQTVSVIINGVTYSFEYFGTVADGLVQGATYSQVPGYGSLGASLDNLATSSNPNAIALLNALGSIPTADLPAALAQLSPAKTSQQFLTQPVTQATFQNLELGQRLALVRSGLAGGADWSGLQFVDAQDPLLSQIKSQLYAYNPVSTPGEVSDTAAPLSSGDQFARWGTFLTGNAILTNQSTTANQNHADSTTVDITAGADYHLNRNWAVGFLLGYGRSTASVDELGSTAGDDQYRFGPYLGYSQGPWFANASTDFAFNEESSTRAIPFLGQQATAHPSGTQYGAEADGGYEFKAVQNKLVYGPTASLQYTHLDIDSYTETGSAADLSIASQHEDSLQSGLGGKASYDAKWSWNGAILRPDLHGSWLHEFMANNDTVNAAFDVPGAQSFSTTFQKQQRDSGLVGCGVQNIFKGGSLLFVNYDAQVGIDNYLAQSISGGVKIVF